MSLLPRPAAGSSGLHHGPLMPTLFAGLLTSLAASAGAQPQDSSHWPRFRGPEGNPVGTHSNLPTRWSDTENVEWAAAIPGVGWSSPVVWGNRIFLTSATSGQQMKGPSLGTDFSNDYIAELQAAGLPPEEVNRRLYARDREMPDEVEIGLHLYCLDLATGELLWEREIYRGRPRGGRHRKNSYASETPVTDGEGVYAYFTHHGLFAFDLEGNRLWTAPIAPFPTVRDFGTGASPALHGDRIYVLNDNEETGFLAAFDKRSGRELWRTGREITERRKTGWSTPFVWENDVRSEIVTVGPGIVISYDLEGSPLWRLGRTAGTPIQSPFAWGGRLFITAGASGGQYRPLAAILPGGSGDITPPEGKTSGPHVLWYERIAGGTYLPTPVIYEDALYVLHSRGIFARHDVETGERIYRSRVAEGAAAFTASPWAYGGHVFALGEEGNTFVIEAGEEYRLVGVNPLRDWALASPAIVGDRLLIRTRQHLYSIRNPLPGG